MATAETERYLDAQRSSDLLLDWGSRSFIMGGYLADCPPDVLDALVEHVEQVPGESSISITAMGGAIDRLPDEASAYTGRGRAFDISPDTSWSDPALDGANATWVRDAMAIVEPHLVPGRYINELSDGGPEITRSSYGDAKLERLRQIKRAWDPTNVFRLNHNIDPA
jgi:FAD/FMN-containing dehydrogenase